MKLNPDCVRAILLTTEENTGFRQLMTFARGIKRFPLLSSYDDDEVLYHIRQCHKADLLECSQFTANSVTITDLTPAGHEFLCHIHENKIWNGVKSIAAKIGVTSLNAFTQIASNVATELIKAYFGLSASGPTTPIF